MLLRKAARDLRAMGARALLIVVVIGAGTGTGAGISLALHDVERTRDNFYAEHRLADLDVRLLRPLAPQPLLERAHRVNARPAETRLVLSGATLLPGAQPAAEVVGMSPAATLNGLAVVDGRGLSASSPRGALLDPDFASRFNLHTGDPLRLRLEGRQIDLRIRGLARNPEYLLATANPDYLVPEPGSLAVVFLPRAALQRLTGLGSRVNDLVADLPGGHVAHRSERLTAGLPVAQVTPRAQQYSLRLTNADIHAFSIFAPVMGGIFALVGLLLIVLSLRRLVNSQRRELGALLALGYRPRTVVATVLLPAAMLALTGGVVAVAVTIGVGRLVAEEYASTVGFPETAYPLAPGPLALAAGLAVGATLIAAILPAYRLARLRPTQAMHGERIVSFGLPQWLQRATAVGPPATVYAIRTLLRRPLLSAATVLSIGTAIGLGAALNILVSSTNRSVDAEFSQQGWTYSVDLAHPLPTTRATRLARRAGAIQAEATIKGPARLRVETGQAADVELAGLPARPPLLRLQLTAGSPPAPGRVVISEQTARTLDAGVGDRLALRTPATQVATTVGGIARTLATESVYLPRAQASRLLAAPGRATSVLIAADRPAARRLRGEPEIARVTSKASAQKAERELIKELTGLISVLQAISLGVGAIFLISTLALSFLDRRGEFATLAALGYGRRQIGTTVAGEALTQTALAAALSIPLGILIAVPLSNSIAEAWFEIGLHPEPPSFIWVIVPALVLALLAVAHATRRALRIDIAATVRARLID
jgi:putative ABC transport system permease protein